MDMRFTINVRVPRNVDEQRDKGSKSIVPGTTQILHHFLHFSKKNSDQVPKTGVAACKGMLTVPS